MKRIAIVTPTFPPYRGGIGKVAEMDAIQLASLGYDVHVYAPDAQPARVNGYEIHALRPWLRWGKGAFVPGVVKLFSHHDFVVLHYPFFGGAEPLSLASKKVKFLLMYHMDVVGTGVLRPFIAWHARMVMPSILRRARCVLVTSTDYAKTSLVSSFSTQELPPGVDTIHFSPGQKSAELLEKYHIPHNAPVAVFVGGLDRPHYFKGVPVLLRALAAQSLASVRAVIVGDGELRGEFAILAQTLGIADRVTFAGSVAEKELPEHLRLGDVFVFPSTDRSEAFGIAALEALACGVPVIASDLPGVRTIVRDHETGLLVPAGSSSALALSMAELLDAPFTRREMGDRARRMVVEEYALEKHAEKWKTLLAGL